ncbi:hypothetical protein DRP04_02190 [Archaeoglobales archaeon]|nr:MAG: hypothetical protein DRP04_02190 [Archaeoglobales archaeon]
MAKRNQLYIVHLLLLAVLIITPILTPVEACEFEELEKARFGTLQQYPNPITVEALSDLELVWDRSAGPGDTPFKWGRIEKVPGEYDWNEVDEYVKWCNENKKIPIAMIFPYAEWDQISCYGGYYEKIPCNLTAYKEFVKKLVERYDGDGVDDMPGLVYPIKYWEVMNEVTPRHWGGQVLGFFNGTAEEYFTILKITYEAIKEADPEAKVLNAGIADMTIGNESGVIECKDFYSKVFELGGANYFDIANIHWMYNLEEFKKFLASHNVTKPIWITEADFVYNCTAGGVMKSPEEAVIDVIRCFEIGAEKITGIGVPVEECYLGMPICYAFKTMVEKLNYFEYMEKISDNCYKFVKDSKITYVIWNSSLPEEIKTNLDNMVAVDIYGNFIKIDDDFVDELVYISTKEKIEVDLSKVPEVNRSYGEALAGRFGAGGTGSIDFATMVEAGVTWKRITISIENYNQSEIDLFIKAAEKAGMILHAILDVSSKIDLDQFAEKVSQIVERYDGDGVNDMPGLKYPVKHYEIFNEFEPNTTPWTNWSYDNYEKYYRAAYQSIKEACSDCQVAPSSFVDVNYEFLKFLKEREIGFDFLSYHSYTDYLHVDELVGVLKELGFENKSIWLTESQFGGMEEKLNRSEEEVAYAMVKSYVYALAKGIDKVEPSEWEAHENYPEGLKWSCLIDENGNKRKAFYAYKTLIDEIDGFESAAIVSLGDLNVVKFTVGGRDVIVAWGTGVLGDVLSGKYNVTGMYGNSLGVKNANEIILDEELIYLESVPENLFSEIPTVDLVAMTPLWPTVSGGPKVLNLDNTAPGGIASDGKYVYVSDTNNNRVLIFDINNLTDQAKAIRVIGQKDVFSRIPNNDTYGLYRPIGIATDGKWLFIADGGNSRIVVYNLTTLEPVLMLGNIENANVSVPIVEFPYTQIDDLAWDGKWLYATVSGGANIVVILKNLPYLLSEAINGSYESEKVDFIVLGEEGISGCSQYLMNSPVGLAVDDKYLYVADRLNGRVLIWDKNNLSDHAPANFVLGYEDFDCNAKVNDPAGSIIPGTYDVASNGKYIFVDDGRGRVLVFERDNLSNGMLAKFVVGRENLTDLSARQVPTKKDLAVPRGLFADDKYLYVADKNFYYPAVLVFNLSKLENGMEADYILGISWPRNPKYDIDVANGKLFVAGQEYVGVFNKTPTENYQYPDLYLGGPFGGGMGGTGVSSDGQHLCIIEKGGTIGIYNEIPNEPKDPDITIKEIGKYGMISGGAASGIACRNCVLAAVSSHPTDSKVLVWKSMPTKNDQEPDVCLTMAAGKNITEPYNVFIYNDTLFVAEHIGSRVLIYYNISELTDDSEPDLIIDKIGGGIHDIFYDGNYLFVSAGSGIHIYHGLPDTNKEADEVITYVNISCVNYRLDPWGIYFDGEYLWVMTGCSEHYSFLVRIPTKHAEVLPPPNKLMRDDFKEYIENGTFPEFLEAFKGIIGIGEKVGKVPPPIDGHQPQDLDKDGLYEDVNGDNSFNFGDIVFFFKNFDRPEIQNYSQYYDFNKDGSVNFGDVVELFYKL